MIFLLKWLKLSLVMSTLFIVIHYLLQRNENQCRMTFMMEPPKFIPVPINMTNQDQNRVSRGYTLFMYSELGFPLQQDARRDLIDSMPVLFVPGNAGSYQQVRSIASTSIRRQLQSLDALKFVFFTIDFGGQLSGLSGDLVEHQVKFVHIAIEKIIDTHPTDTNGIILIGHSVGGFIAKALSSAPDFKPNSLSLIINLASPIADPNLNFDRKLTQLYHLTYRNWLMGHKSTALSISISSGTSDRLVPMHLSLDPQYDISIATSSIKDVWLTTDHVSITWCGELMNKLARLLSALMDKRKTRLIEGRTQQMAIVMDELLTRASDEIATVSQQSSDEQAMVKTEKVIEFSNYFMARRETLIDMPILLNLTNQDRSKLLVWIEYIESFDNNGIFGCREIIPADKRFICDGEIRLTDTFRTIPSLRYELKKKLFFIRGDSGSMKYLILNFAPNLTNSETRKLKVPESISIQNDSDRGAKDFRIPTLFEYLHLYFFNPTALIKTIGNKHDQPVTYYRYGLTGLNETDQLYSIKIESESCESNYEQFELTALLVQDSVVARSYHLTKDETSLMVELDARRFILLNDQSTATSQAYLDVFIRGPCSASLEIKPDLWRFLEFTIQYYPSEILQFATFTASVSLIAQRKAYRVIIATLVIRDVYSRVNSRDIEGGVVKLLAILVLANGLLALIERLTDRLVDLATIIFRFHHSLRNRVSDNNLKETKEPRETKSRDANKEVSSKFDLEWLVIALITVSSFMLSVTIMKLYAFFLLLKQRLKLATKALERPGDESTQPTSSGGLKSTTNPPEEDADKLNLLTIRLTTLCALGIICYIPTALLKINEIKLGVNLDPIFFITLICLIMVKLICSDIKLSQSILRFQSHVQVCSIAFHSVIFGMNSVREDIRDIIYAELPAYTIAILSVGALVKDPLPKRKSD